MANTFTLISSVTVGAGGQTNIAFNAIPQTYTDLKLLINARGTYSQTRVAPYMTFNGSTTGYTDIRLYGQDAASGALGSSANDGSNTSIGGMRIPAANAYANTFGYQEIYIPNYASTSINKRASFETYAGNNSVTDWMLGFGGGLWSSTAAITSISFSTSIYGIFAQYSTAFLYGINKS